MIFKISEAVNKIDAMKSIVKFARTNCKNKKNTNNKVILYINFENDEEGDKSREFVKIVLDAVRKSNHIFSDIVKVDINDNRKI